MTRGPMTLVTLSRSDDFSGTITGLLAGVEAIRIQSRVGDLGSDEQGLAPAIEAADVLLVDIQNDDERELRQLGRIIERGRGRRAVIATAANLSSQGIRGLIRQGVDDFVPQPIAKDDLVEAVRSARTKLRQARGSAGLGKVIAVSRAKGGMGASTMATHIALALGEKRHRKDPEKQVALLDLDLQFGDLGLMLDLEPSSEMVEIMRDPQRLDSDLLRSSMVRHGSGLSVLPAPAELVPLEAFSTSAAVKLVELAREEFDYVVLDLPLAAPRWLEGVLRQADQLVLVTQLNVAAIRQTRRLLDVLKEEGLYDLPVSVVMNRYVWRLSERSRINQAIKALGQPFAHYLPDDPGLALEALNRGTPLFELRRRAKLCRSLRAFAGSCVTLLQQHDDASATATARTA